MEPLGMMRDLDQIRERDDARESSRLVLIALGGLASACVLFTVGVLIGREGDPSRGAPRREDPLARLDALAGQVADGGAPAVTYPERLVDRPAGDDAGAAPVSPEVMRAAAGVPASALVEPTGHVRSAIPTAAELPVAPTTRAAPASEALAAPAPPGSEGPYTLQVSSFRTLTSAQTFAQRLRERGHRAFVVASPATSSGTTWHRVRIGPFTSQREAERYRGQFESRERLPSFVVRRDEAPRSH